MIRKCKKYLVKIKMHTMRMFLNRSSCYEVTTTMLNGSFQLSVAYLGPLTNLSSHIEQ